MLGRKKKPRFELKITPLFDGHKAVVKSWEWRILDRTQAWDSDRRWRRGMADTQQGAMEYAAEAMAEARQRDVTEADTLLMDLD